MPPAKETTPGFAAAAPIRPRVRSSSAATIWALREKRPGQLSGGCAGAAGLGAISTPGGAATNVPCPTWARAQPAATSSS